MSVLFLLAGALLLYLGGEVLVSNAARLARIFGLSPLVIGLTVVAFATSAPELFATLVAALQGAPELGLGNVLGSNIANLGLILGLAALLSPLVGKARFVAREIPLLIAVAVAPFFLLLGDVIGRLEGAVLVLLLIAYVVYLLRDDEHPEVEEEFAGAYRGPGPPWWVPVLGVALGLALLVGGAHLLVSGAVEIARALGVSERVIGLTLVAFGTSLPELASSLVAARRREGDIVLGNVVGSNIFNVLCVLGLTAVVQPIEVAWTTVRLDMWAGLAFSLAMLPLLLLGRRLHLGRLEGLLLVLGYGVYVWVLFV